MAESRWTPEFLASMRHEADPEADAVVSRLFEEGGLDGLKTFHGHLLGKDGVPRPGLPDYVVEYLDDTARPPEWVDREALSLAEGVLTSNGLLAFTILAGASLPECYVDHLGIPVLWQTQKINAHVYRRVVETSQFVIGVMSPGGMDHGGKGLEAAQKVRLMHASVRYLMLHTPDETLARGQTPDIADVFRDHRWKEELGLPMNQEDMAYTLQTFAWVTVRGLRDLECGLSPDEEEGIIHLWNATGHVMGIRRDLLPDGVEEARILFEACKARVAGECDEGKSLTAALLRHLESQIPGFLHDHFRHLPRMLVRHLVDEPTAEMLGVPALTPMEEKEAHAIIGSIDGVDHVANHLFERFSPVRKAAEWLFRHMLESYARLPRGWERDLFAVPEHLADSWQLVTEPE